MEIKKVLAFAIAALVAGFVGFNVITSEEVESPMTGDAATALSNLTGVLESLVDPVVALLVIVFIIGMVFRIFDGLKGRF